MAVEQAAWLVGCVVAAAVALPLLSRWLQSPSARSGGSSGMGDAFGNLTDVFNPGQARATRDLKDHHHAGPVTRSPEDEDTDPVRILPGQDGRPASVRVRKTPPESP